MIVALTDEADKSIFNLDQDNLQLQVKLSLTLGITPDEAKRKVTRFLMDEVSLLIIPQASLLVIAAQNSVFWRFPLIFSMGLRGKLGQVGEIDVDARTGELLLNDNLIADIQAHTHLLAQSSSLSTGN